MYGLEPGTPQYDLTFLSRDELENTLCGRGIDALEINKVIGAYEMAESIHEFQERPDGTPFFWHPSRVAKIMLAELNQSDTDILCAALLHHALDDVAFVTSEILEINFGFYTSSLIQVLAKEVHTQDRAEESVENAYIEKLCNAPEEVRLIKLAERLDTCRCIRNNLRPSSVKYVRDTTNYLTLAKDSHNPQMSYLIKEIQKEQNKFLG
jgi:(p)ppGpp synthase/HD superfamily hydrolase